jgi:hypothetical protein
MLHATNGSIERMDDILTEFRASPPGADSTISDAEVALGVNFPADYREFLRLHDGGEGFLGKHYVRIWSASELCSRNRDYQFPLYAPDLVAIGSDGGGEAFAFDTRGASFKVVVVVVPFIGLAREDAIVVSDTFEGFLRRMRYGDGSLLGGDRIDQA